MLSLLLDLFSWSILSPSFLLLGSFSSRVNPVHLWNDISFWTSCPGHCCWCFTVTQSCLTLCNPMQQVRLPCPSPSPRVCSNSCPLSRWCHPTISSSFSLFSFCVQSFPASEYFPMSQLFASGGQSVWSFSFCISPSKEYSGLISFRMDWLDLLAVQGTLKSLL